MEDLIFTAEESKDYHLSKGYYDDLMPARKATIDHPVWTNFCGEWFEDNGEW